MVIVLIAWVIIFLSCLGAARLLNCIFRISGSSVFIDFFVGLAFFATIANFASLAFPLKGLGIGFSLFAFFGVKPLRTGISTIAINKFQISFLLVAFGLILLQSSKTAFVTDTGLYHVQTVRWAEEYPVIKGLGNLHGRLAFNSSFHLLIAAFSLPILNSHSILPGLIILISTIYFVDSIFSYYGKNTLVVSISFVSIILLLVFYRDWISSPSPDPLVTVLILLSAILFIDNGLSSKNTFIHLVLIGSFAITVKLSAICILLFPVSFFLLTKIQFKSLAKHIFIPIIIGIPFLIRNYYLSGYLLYPVPFIDFFVVDWKVPMDLVIREKEWVHSFARSGSYSWGQSVEMTFPDWIPIWWKNQVAINKLIMLGIIFSMIISPIYLIRKETARTLLVFSISLIGIIFWFTQAPYLRFGHGFIILIIAFNIFMTMSFLQKRYKTQVPKTMISILLVLYSYSLFREYQEGGYDWVCPKDYLKPTYNQYVVSGQVINKPVDSDLCWDTPIPCTPYQIENIEIVKNIDSFYFRTSSNP